MAAPPSQKHNTSIYGEKMISENDLKKIESTVGYRFRDRSLLIQAFTRTSFVNEAKQAHRGSYQSNEVLELLGDSILGAAIITRLLAENARRYEHGLFTELDEGDFSNIKSHLSDKSNLSRSMDALGLAKYLVMGDGDRKSGIANEPSVKEDLFESIIGAVYLDSDGDLSSVSAALNKMLDISIYVKGAATKHNPKGALQEWCQDKKRRLPMPRYETLDESGPAHKKTFMRACYVGERLCGRGVGKNQPEADAQAAEAALAFLMAEEQNGNRLGERIDTDAQTKLRNHAAKNKLPYPEFRDLGENAGSGAAMKLYDIECRYLGKVTVGTGASKSDARMKSAARMLIEAGIEEPKKEEPAPKSKSAGKPSAAKKQQKPRKSANKVNKSSQKSKK